MLIKLYPLRHLSAPDILKRAPRPPSRTETILLFKAKTPLLAIHDGQITVENEQGVGTSFRVMLPVLERDLPRREKKGREGNGRNCHRFGGRGLALSRNHFDHHLPNLFCGSGLFKVQALG